MEWIRNCNANIEEYAKLIEGTYNKFLKKDLLLIGALFYINLWDTGGTFRRRT